MTSPPVRSLALASLLAMLCAGCVVPQLHRYAEPMPVVPPPAVDRALEDRILALDPERIGPADVKDVLARGPTPRIMLLHGGIYPVHLSMTSFGRFLVAMGYREAKIRNPYDGTWSHSPYEDAERLAGIVAWYYEREGMPPMLIGHSQGGMQAIKILHVLNGEYSAAVPVWNLARDSAESRTTIVDPLTGRERPVVRGFQVTYTSAVGAGGAAFLLPNQWSLLGKLRTIPDTVEYFTGYVIDIDLWAWTLPGVDATRTFSNDGSASVRNVTLAAVNNHVLIPMTDDLPEKPAVRAWIDAYVPGTRVPPPPDSGDNLLWAADVWHSVKKFWTIEAQRVIRARRAGARPAVAGKLE